MTNASSCWRRSMSRSTPRLVNVRPEDWELFRRALGMTYPELAQELGIHMTSLYRYRDSQRSPRLVYNALQGLICRKMHTENFDHALRAEVRHKITGGYKR